MLKTLYIENLAVIEKMTVNFELGLTVFTGETGAGKSILIDAINLVLGQRSTKDIVRTGTKKAVVSAVFSNISTSLLAQLIDFGYEAENGEVMLSREIGIDGKSIARLMGRPVTVGILRELGTKLINIHGQHDNQVLLNQENHMDILDAYADNSPELQQYKTEYANYVQLKSKYKQISMNEQEKARRIDLLTYQVEEIFSLNLVLGEDGLLQERLNAIRNSAKITEALSSAHAALYGVDGVGGCYDSINSSAASVERLSSYHSNLQAITEQLEGIRYEIEDAAENISTFLETIEFHQIELDEAEQRMEEIDSLKRKYGSTIEEILLYGQQAQKELENIQMSEQMQHELLIKIDAQKKAVMSLGKSLSETRQRAGKRFVEQVGGELAFLDMPNVVLKVLFTKAKYGGKGCDEVEFLFSTNKGEELKSISKIASGGELSRIMLAIKSVLAEKDDINTLIFDEIDTGVSGQSAQKIGLKLKSVSNNRQVLCVTHSAQIATLAHHNFLIKKETDNERTYTKILPLDDEGKIYEVARIMATDEITDLMLETARAMILSQKG